MISALMNSKTGSSIIIIALVRYNRIVLFYNIYASRFSVLETATRQLTWLMIYQII